MKKILSFVVLCFFLAVQTSYAFLPVAIPAWYYGAGALAVGGGAGVYCAMKSGYVATVDIAGNIRRKAGLAWVALSTASVPTLYERNLVAKKTFDQIKSLANLKPSTYPNVKSALSAPGSWGSLSSDLPGGTKITVTTEMLIGGSAGNYTITSKSYGPALYVNYHYNLYKCEIVGGALWYYYPVGGNTYRVAYNVSTTTAPSPVESTPSQFANTLTGVVVPSGIEVDSAVAYQAELDAMVADPDYVPVFTDETTGLPPAYPSNPLTPTALAAVNAQGIAVDEREQALTAAQQAAASAVAAKDAAVSAANADPTNTALAQKAADATAAASAATAAAQKVAAENATTAAQEAANEAAKESAVGITIPAVKSFSWGRFADLKGALAATFPFYLIPKIGDLMGQIAPETPTPPVFTLPVYGKTYQISLEMFDPIASALRGFIAVIASIACIIMMVKFYRGTS